MTRCLRRTLLVAALVVAAGTASCPAAVAEGSEQREAHVDRQTYVTTTPVDPYAGDTSAIHVAAQAGQEQARSFVHFDLGGEQLLDGTIRFTPTGTAGVGNVNTSAVAIKACVLTQPLPATVSATNAPKADCSQGSADGKPDQTGVWSFPLGRLAPYLAAHANPGLALIPVIADPTSSWSISFDVLKTSATVTVTVGDGTENSSGAFGPSTEPAPQPQPAPASGALPGTAGLAPTGSFPAPAPGVPAPAPAVAAAPLSPLSPQPAARTRAAAHHVNSVLVALLIALLAIVVGFALLTSKPVAAVLSRSSPAPLRPSQLPIEVLSCSSVRSTRPSAATSGRWPVATRPFIVGLLTLALIVVAVPTKTFQPGSDSLASGSAAGARSTQDGHR